MLSREERTEINKRFWKKFKTFSRKFKNSEDKVINWVNYPTFIKQLYVRLNFNHQIAQFSIEIQDKDEGIRQIIWEQFTELKKVMLDEMESDGVWEEKAFNDAGQSISRISWSLEDVSILQEEDELKVMNFFMDRLTRFDRFYQVYNEILFALVK